MDSLILYFRTRIGGSKLLLRNSGLLVLFSFLAITEAFGTTYSHTISAKTWSAYGAQTLSSVSWTAAATGGSYWGYDAAKGQQFGSASSPAKPLTLSTSGISGTITSVKITTSGASSVVGTVAVTVGGTAFSPASASLTSTSAAYTFTGSKSGQIVITWNQTSSKALYIQAIEVVYSSVSAPTVTTPTATAVTATTATLGANVTSDGGATLTSRGTVWGTSAAPTTNAVAEGGTGTGVFTQARTGFTANTLYYYRGYATNSAGTAYSADGTFTTLPGVPGVAAGSDATVNSLVANWTAPTGGSVAFTYEIQVDDNSDFSSPAFTKSAIASTNTSVIATGLTSGTNYYYRVRATNVTGSSAWSSVSVAYATLSGSLPTVTTPTATAVTATTATLGANVTSNGGTTLTARGTVWGTSAAPTTNAVAEGGTGTGVFTQARTGFTANTLYYYRGYATNSAGTAYSADGTFTTLPGVPGIAAGSGATVNSLVANWTAPTGGSVAFTYEVQVDDNSDFSSPAFTQSAIASTNTSVIATGLAQGTNYYYRVRATNVTGSSAWSSVSVAYATLVPAPTLTLSPLTDMGTVCVNSVSAPATFTITGTALTTADITVNTGDQGFTFSTTADGTYSASLSIPQSGGVFSQTIYVKFAPTDTRTYHADIFVDGGGAAEGALLTVTGTGVNSAPTIASPSATTITAASAVLGANITQGGCTEITARGIVWSTTDGFAVEAGTVVSETGTFTTGAFTFQVTGLKPATTVYYKAFATNAGGTSYTSQGSFATSTLSKPVAAPATAITSDGFTANWGAVEGAVGYILNVYTGSVGTSTVSEGFVNGITAPTGWTFTNIAAGSTYTSTGNYGAASPSLKLDATGDIVTTPLLSGDATSFSFWAKGQTVSGGTSLLVEGYNGSTWTAIQTITLTNTGTTYTYNASTSPALPSGIKQFRLTFTKSSGNLSLDDVVYTYYTSNKTEISGSPFTPAETSQAITGLNPATTYYYTVTAKNGAVSSAVSDEISVTTDNSLTVDADKDASSLPNCPTCNVKVNNGAHLTVSAAKTYAAVTVNPTAKLTIGEGVTLTAPLTVKSDATGTGTLIGNVTGAATVQQYLPGAGRQWWYLSSPVAGATSAGVFAANDKVGVYDETTTSYSSPFSTATVLQPGTGYVVKRALTTEGTYAFEGTLNNGDIAKTLTRTGTTAGKRGFNLVGNPYPSYLNWDDVIATATNVRNAIWYRTFADDAMTFHTYADGIGVPETVTSAIAPMQAFWVRVDKDGDAGGSLNFKNIQRKHAGASDGPLKAPATDTRAIIRLQVSNGKYTDETLLVAKSYASNGADSYDIEKMSNDNNLIPEIYSIAGNQSVVINSVNNFNPGQEFVLGFRPGTAGDFSITGLRVSNMPANVAVILKDKLTGVDTELSEGIVYSFSADATATDSRFSILTRAKGVTTGTTDAYSRSYSVSVVAEGLAIAGEGLSGSTIRVYNAAGQIMYTARATSDRVTVNGNFGKGVYIVKVNETVQKVSISNR